MRFPDGELEPSLALRKAIVRATRRLKADVVICQDPRSLVDDDSTYLNHPDHRAAGQAALDAAFPAAGNPSAFRDLLAEGLEPHKPREVWLYFTSSAHANHWVDMGRSFAAWAAYRRIDDAATYPQVIVNPVSRGALVYLNINNFAVDPTTGAKVPYCWSNVSNGNEDPMIDAWAQAIIASGYMDKTIVTFSHEPDVNTSAQPKCSTDDAAEYQLAFDHFSKRLRSDGVTSRFAFVPTGKLYATSAISSYLPPAGDFQLIGADVYNMSADPTSAKYRTVSEAFGPLYEWADANEPGMPLIIGELGENQNDPNAPQWISDALNYMKSNGNLLFVNWNLEDSATTYFAPLVRSDSMEAWLLGAADPYFGG